MKSVALVAAVLAIACGKSDPESAERSVERSYDVYEAVADAINTAPDCTVGVARANAIVRERRADLEEAFAIQGDPARLEAAREALRRQEERYRRIEAALDMAFTRCANTPGLESLDAALESAPAEPSAQ